MNERIKLLAEQCRKEVEHFSSDTGFTYTEEFDEEKFAELIVLECVAMCEKNADHEYLGAGSKLCAFNIKQHFGVKE